MASYKQRGIPNEYTSNLNINTYPDSDESDFSDSDAEHANVMFSRHTVALDSNLEESDVQRGIYNRHNFLVNNYNNVQAQNFMQLRISSKKMPRLVPMGGIRSRHMTSRFERRNFENLLVILMGWMAGLFPPVALLIVGYCHSFAVQFFVVYLLASLFSAHVASIVILRSNAKLFCKCPFMIPVTITSHHLHGLQNNFKDIPIDEFTGMKIVKYSDRKAIHNTVTYLGIIDQDEFTVRVMFYSPDYFYKYLTVPQNRLYKLIALSFVCLVVSFAMFIKIQIMHKI